MTDNLGQVVAFEIVIRQCPEMGTHPCGSLVCSPGSLWAIRPSPTALGMLGGCAWGRWCWPSSLPDSIQASSSRENKNTLLQGRKCGSSDTGPSAVSTRHPRTCETFIDIPQHQDFEGSRPSTRLDAHSMGWTGWIQPMCMSELSFLVPTSPRKPKIAPAEDFPR